MTFHSNKNNLVQRPPQPKMSPIRRKEPESYPPEESVIAALIGGGIGTAIGTFVWAMFTAVSGIKITLLAVGLGGLAGLGVRLLGNGQAPMYRIIAAVYAFSGTLIGNVLVTAIYINQKTGVSIAKIMFTPKIYIAILKSSSFMDYFFYILSVYVAFTIASTSEPLENNNMSTFLR